MFGEVIDFGEMVIITVFSMGVVFATLLIISLILDLFKVVFVEKKSQEVKKEPQPQTIAAAPEPIKTDVDEELVAVITAAIAAYIGKGTDKLIVRRITPMASQEPIWAQMGRIDQMRIGG
jgi:sodium pump decarboxylase gamma subunit